MAIPPKSWAMFVIVEVAPVIPLLLNVIGVIGFTSGAVGMVWGVAEGISVAIVVFIWGFPLGW